MTLREYKADLHVHSCHSNKPSYWALRKFKCPESFTSPRHIYDTARAAGMDYVTVTDHNSISGALEIAHLPGVIVGSELTSYFPADGCKVHVVTLGLTEEIFRELSRLRRNIFELVPYLHEQGIPHFLAHPLYAQNENLSASHIEQLLLLFRVFEVRNGARAHRFNEFTDELLKALTPARMEQLANRHDLEPSGERPWLKGRVGGSDDHSGLFIGRACTVARRGDSPEEFMQAIMDLETEPAGDHGDPLTLAHSLYGIAYRFYRERLNAGTNPSTPFVNTLLARMFDSGRTMTVREKFRFLVRKNLPELFQRRGGASFEEVLDREARMLLSDSGFMERLGPETRNRKIFAISSHLANRLLYHYSEKLTRLSLSGGMFNLFQSVSTMGLVHLLISPYYLAYHHQHRGKELMGELDERLEMGGAGSRKEKIALFTDTLDDINGVAITIRRLIATARIRGVELTVITSSRRESGYADGVMNFKSLGDFVLPEYPELRLNFPPVLDVMDYVEREGFTAIHVSTPGTVGLLGLLTAKLMDIPAAGTYHTDIPQYVRDLTNDEVLERAAWNYMIWFYRQMDEVMVPSASTRRQLVEQGLPEEKTRPLPRWVDVYVYTPLRRNPAYWRRYGLGMELKLLYVGRVSREKNLEMLADAYRRIADHGVNARLVIVGDGPYRAEMENRLSGCPALFTGYLEGDALQDCYASADLFVFPSTTDTFGNVVLEAQASGLPVIVSDEGGPQELMEDGKTGIVVRSISVDGLVTSMLTLLKEPSRLSEMGRNARAFAERGSDLCGDAYSTILRQPQARAANS